MKTLEQYLAEMDDIELSEESAKNAKLSRDILEARQKLEKNIKRGGISHAYSHEEGWKEVK